MSETLSRDLLDLSAGELAQAVRERRVSAVELADAAIARIEARDGAINAVVVRDFDRARAAARLADKAVAHGEPGALLGVPMTVKESHAVAGLPFTWGFEPFREMTAQEDSVGVSRLKAAGAVILGKTNVPVMLADWQSVNPIHGRTVNPWDPTRSAGGSSGGSAAALAAGMVPLEFGSDIGGSIRVPAAFCGVFGHKPSYGLIPSRGHAPPGVSPGAPVPLAVVGPLARTAGDLQLALDVLAGPDADEAVGYRLALPAPRHDSLAGHRVLILDELPDAPLDDEIRQALAEVATRLERQGAGVARKSDRLPDLSDAREIFGGLLDAALTRGQPGAKPVDAHAYMMLQDRQVGLRREWADFFQSFDVVLAPVFGTVAFPHDERPPERRSLTINGKAWPYFSNMAWPAVALAANLPATAVPVGFTRGGLPIGIQVIGPYLEDRTTIAFAGHLEREFGGFRSPPPL